MLSNGSYSVLLTAAGSGYSVVDGMDVTRWREDATRDCWGQYCYVRDLDDRRIWSAGRQPLGQSLDEDAAQLGPDIATLRRRDGEIETRYEVVVVPDANAELRRVTLTNLGGRRRNLDVTSYVEIALNPRGADQAHPAFQKLFLETDLSTTAALLCRRRPRARDQQPVWALHVLSSSNDASGTPVGEVQLDTDRARFLGRGRSAANPLALESAAPLSRTSGRAGPHLQPPQRRRARAEGIRGPGVHDCGARGSRRGASSGEPVPRPERRGSCLRRKRGKCGERECRVPSCPRGVERWSHLLRRKRAVAL